MALTFLAPAPVIGLLRNSLSSNGLLYRPQTPCPSKRRQPRQRFAHIQAVLSSSPKSSAPAQNSEKRFAKPTTTNSDWMFFDVARILVKGGQGGNGCVAFRREKGIPRGGPSGGNGGRGGSIIFVAKSGANTLAKFRGGAAFRANEGTGGQGKNRNGVAARDMVVPVPLGTVIRDDEGKLLADLTEDGRLFKAARGGRGGRGNNAFKTDSNRAPQISENGQKGIERRLRLELKLVADVALVGFPNAGKSTLLDSISNARPKIAAYPFTTIVPNLGVVDSIDGAEGLVIADVPGLIVGAHRGAGMGVSFLRHVERCKVVVHILDGTSDDVIGRYKAIRREMELFDDRLSRKKEVVLLNKVDQPGIQELWDDGLKQNLVETIGVHKRIAIISAKSKTGLTAVIRKLKKLVDNVVAEDNLVLLGDEDEEGSGMPPVTVEVEGEGRFRVGGYEVDNAFHMTKFAYFEGVDRFQRILAALGANRMLEEAGAKDGDVIICGEYEFNFYRDENIYSAAAAFDGYRD